MQTHIDISQGCSQDMSVITQVARHVCGVKDMSEKGGKTRDHFCFDRKQIQFLPIRVLSILDWHLIASQLETWSGLQNLKFIMKSKNYFTLRVKTSKVLYPKIRAVATLGLWRTLFVMQVLTSQLGQITVALQDMKCIFGMGSDPNGPYMSPGSRQRELSMKVHAFHLGANRVADLPSAWSIRWVGRGRNSGEIASAKRLFLKIDEGTEDGLPMPGARASTD